MKTLTNIQKEYLAETFFETEKYAGWKNIALLLLSTGECIVAGDKCIWIGGVGNFIETKKAYNTVGCVVYKFDLKEFLFSQYFKHQRSLEVKELVTKANLIAKTIEDLTLL